MFQCITHNTPYKGIFILILLFVILEYLLNSVRDPREPLDFYNSSRYTSGQNLSFYDQFVKTSVSNSSAANITTDNSLVIEFYPNNNYIITIPPFLLTNITSTISINDSSSQASTLATTDRPKCPDTPNYGAVKIIKEPVPSLQDLEQRFSWLHSGGHYEPPSCLASNKIALVIPFRCRAEHLLLFLQHMHPFLRKQQLDYTIFIVEQDGDGPFNRAMLMNVGYVEALKRQPFNCFIFHDIDLLPEDDRNLYSCPQHPRHMSVAVDVFNYELPYPAIFGGVSAISTKDFQILNGFSNSFWGWGGEDDDMSNRIRHHHLNISRYPITIARYTMLTHKKNKANPKRYEILKNGVKRFNKDGLNNLSYDVIDSKDKLLYTWILVRLPSPGTS